MPSRISGTKMGRLPEVTWKNAQRLEIAREHEPAGMQLACLDIHRNRAGIAHDRKDRSHNVAARSDEHAGGAAEVAKRNYNASANC